MKSIISLLIICLSLSKPILSQVLYADSELLDYYRVLEIKNLKIENRLNISPFNVNQYDKDSVTWNVWSQKINFAKETKKLTLLPIRAGNHFNSSYARSYNDGALWKGKGYTGSIQGGVHGKWGILEYTVAPLVYFSQNTSFELAETVEGNNPFNYQLNSHPGRIDYVQRYGEDSFTEFNWGQTDVRLVYKSFTLGISNQNIVWGPAQRNPILLSDNASGIPHLDLGTHKPIDTKIGRIETKMYYGILRNSDYFIGGRHWKYRYWSGISIGYNPSFLPSLFLGFNRSFYKKGQEFVAKDLLVPFVKLDDTDGIPEINDEFDQMGSLTMRWLMKDAGFEAYVEFAKNDFGGKFWGTEPEHARGYTLGFSKYVDIKEHNVLKLTYEHTSVDKAKNFTYRNHNAWYTHGIVGQGYTLEGQIIGAGIGPGSTTDFFDAQYFYKKGSVRLSAQRIRFNDDYFFQNVNDEFRHDHEWTFDSRFSRFVGDYLISFDLGVSLRENVYFIEDNDENNLFLGISLTKLFNQ